MTKILKILGATIGLALLGIILALIWYRYASQPQISGRLQMAGLSAPVDIVRDSEGVPHIYAKSSDDAYFALGFVHAQDRLWQMEMNRRIAAGRVAEILGPNALGTDRFLRTLGIKRNAEAIVANLSPETRGVLEAYAKGVNAYLIQRTQPLPPEFLLTGAPAPASWTPSDSIGWQTMMAWDLGGNWTQELLRMRLAQRLSLAQINEFLAPYPGDKSLPTQDYTTLYRELPATVRQLDAAAKTAPPGYVEGMGSNGWVVSGELSITGKPLLANDPHLGLSAPSVWYLAHLSAPGLNVVGATLPGIPGIVLGRNDRIAWSYTNTAPDVQDLYIERINPANPLQYQTPDGWADFKQRTETIKVKGQGDVTLDVRESRHGPVITGVAPVLGKTPLDANNHVVAFAWTALRPDDLTFQAATKFSRAANWDEFVNAAKDFGSPQQNIVYADVDGNTGFIAPARVPIRKVENDLKGLAPAPGWDARYDWDGFIPFDQLPRQFNPESHRIVTANQKIVADDYPFFLSSEWPLPFRANRIGQMLDAREKHSAATFAEMQTDVVSLAAQELLPELLKTKPRSTSAKLAIERLAKWKGSMDAGATEPLIFSAWTRETSRRIFSDELGAELMNDYWDHRNVHRSMVNVLKNVDGQERWCLDMAAKAATPPQSCNDLLAVSLDAALADLEKRYGADWAEWKWGTAHFARSEHRPFAKVDSLARIFDIRVPSPGDTFTVNVGRNNLRDEAEPFAAKHAVSFRAIYDLADLESSRFIHATGQSGNVTSPLYRNYAQRWVDGKSFALRTTRSSVEAGSVGTLTISP